MQHVFQNYKEHIPDAKQDLAKKYFDQIDTHNDKISKEDKQQYEDICSGMKLLNIENNSTADYNQS